MPEIDIFEKALGSVCAGLLNVPVIVALNRKKGISTVSEVRYAIFDEDAHGSVIPRRPAPA